MGAWLATRLRAVLSKYYRCQLLLIDPCLGSSACSRAASRTWSPLALYQPVEIPDNAYYFIARYDGVIDHSDIIRQVIMVMKGYLFLMRLITVLMGQNSQRS
jgi:hypothetical protein